MAEPIQPHPPETNAGDEYIANRRLAQVYAEALLSVAEKHNQVEEVVEELRGLVDEVFRANPEIETLFSSKAVRRAQKEPIIRAALGGKVTDTLLHFLLVLNERDRLELLRPVFLVCRELLDQRAKRVRVHVRTAAALDDEQQHRLAETLRASLHLQPILDVHVDPSLLGGMVVRVGDTVYDNSVSTRIENIRNQLLARSNYEVQAGRDRFSHRQAD